jgi:hypothetical protein
MDDRDWEQFARAPNVLRRVNLLRYLAAKEISMERKSRADQATAEFNDEMVDVSVYFELPLSSFRGVLVQRVEGGEGK